MEMPDGIPKTFHVLVLVHTFRTICMCSKIDDIMQTSQKLWSFTGSTFAQVMACCLMAPSHYLNQCWLIINEVFRHSTGGNVIANAVDTLIHHPGNKVLIGSPYSYTCVSWHGRTSDMLTALLRMKYNKMYICFQLFYVPSYIITFCSPQMTLL